MRLAGRDGATLWQHSYTGGNFNLSYSFTMAANRSMEQVLEKFGRDVVGEEFFRACCQSQARPADTP